MHAVGYSTVLLTMSIPPTCDPSVLAFPTPLFPDLDPRTAPSGTQGLVLQLWRVTVEPYGDDAVKGAGQKGWYGFVRRSLPHFSLSLLARLVRALSYSREHIDPRTSL